MDLMQVLQGQLSGGVLDQISQHIGAEKEQTASAANDIFGTLLGGLANNASSESGLSALSGALDRDHDGSVLDDLMGMLGGAMQGNQSGATNGMGILGHILGGQQEAAAQHIGQRNGLGMEQIMKLMPILAPIVMGVLGKAKGNGVGIGDLAGILTGSAQNAQQQGGMGDLLGAVLGQVLGGGQQQQPQQQQQQGDGLLGNILGGIFGGR
jgi:hypothetical protein